MVLTAYFVRIKALSFAILTATCLIAILLSFLACGTTIARRSENEPTCKPELVLKEDQIQHIKDSLARQFQWDAYWTYSDTDALATYDEKIGRHTPIVLFAFRHGTVVFAPTMDKEIIAFHKNMDDRLSSPLFLGSALMSVEEFKQEPLLGIAKTLGDWRTFIELTQGNAFDYASYRDRIAVPEELKAEIERNKTELHIPVALSDDQMKSYIATHRDVLGYCQTNEFIRILPISRMRFDTMNDEKRRLLLAIEQEALNLAKTMFRRRSVTITIPDFGYDDAQIMILFELKKDAYTMRFSLDAARTEAPVKVLNTFEIQESPRYGISLHSDTKIKRQALKVLKYTP